MKMERVRSTTRALAVLFMTGCLCVCVVACEEDKPVIKTCIDHVECSAGEICYFGKCQAGCQQQSDCPEGLVCLSNGLCQAENTCLIDADCCVGTVPGTCELSCVDGSCVGSACEGSQIQDCFHGCHKGINVCVDGGWTACDASPYLDEEICGDGIDNDCLNGIDDGCDPCNPPPQEAEEICGDGVDNNCDGYIDEDCVTPCEPGTQQECSGACGPGVTTCQEDQTWGACEEEEECSCTPGAESLLSCGNCGEGIHTCVDSGGEWVLSGECIGAGPCAPEDIGEESCGKCGVITRVCDDQCAWGEPSECTNEVGLCAPGDRVQDECGLCGIKEQECSETCEWGPFGECTGEGECAPGNEDTFACGKCGTRTSMCTSECEWGAPGECLDQGVCNPDEIIVEACDINHQKTNVCNGECQWSGFGECEPVVECSAGEFLCPNSADCCTYSSDGCDVVEDPYCPGCICANCVCQIDSYCCTVMWDSVCASKCEGQCGGCGTFNDGCQVTYLSDIPTQYSSCDGGAIAPVSGHCYKEFPTFPFSKWQDAQDSCEDWGGYLVTISSDDENQFVRDIANCSKFWMGLSDSETEGAFVWVDGNPISGPWVYDNWDDGEPNDKSGEDCAHMHSDGTWNDEGCDESYCFVCEKNLQSASGCDGCVCEDCVCAMDSFCCNSSWDAKCVEECANDCGGCGYGGCEEETDAGCDGCPCQECVCAEDAYCCDTKWDQVCADACVQDCGGCAPLPAP